ncbi:hypothetical protein FE257_001265 [Aspergillus nanangensis]|uniref:Uncharacterized protein n=1 Tax=Aspergillus nanangensis TaxID=2582783 RepID=A0AAD4CE57_ASPNN|nr:hypothetical protein FE257_001265 [Aspergillus nanangensis]
MPVVPENPFELPSKQGNSNNSSTSQDQNKSAQENREFSTRDLLSKGPQIPDELPPKVPRDEIEARKKELNQNK